MIRKSLVLAVLMFAVVGLAFAGAKPGGIARELSMGGSNIGGSTIQMYGNLALNPYIWDDPTLNLINPAFISLYPDYVTFNVAGGCVRGTNAYEYGHEFTAGNFAISKEVTLGAILSYDPSSAALVSQGLQTYLNSVGPRASQGTKVPDVLELVGAFDLGKLTLGLGVLYGSQSQTSKTSSSTTSSENELSASVLAFRAGLLADFTPNLALDANVFFRMDNAEDNLKGSPTSNGSYSASGTEIGVMARVKVKMSQKVNLVPHAMFGSFSAEPEEDAFPTGGTAITTKVENSGMLFGLGVGAEVKTKTFFLAGGVAFRTQSLETKITPAAPALEVKQTSSATGIPVINLGAEWWFLDWLGARAGYYRSWVTETSESESGSNSSENSSMFGWSNVAIGSYGTDFTTDNSLLTLGIGLQFGGFSLDAMVSEHALQRGLGLIGTADNTNSFGYATLSYNFAE